MGLNKRIYREINVPRGQNFFLNIKSFVEHSEFAL